jgi:hypothetical protein
MQASHWGAQVREFGWRVNIPTVANYLQSHKRPFLCGLAATCSRKLGGCNVEMSTICTIVQVHGIAVTPGAPIAVPKEKVKTNLLPAAGSLL